MMQSIRVNSIEKVKRIVQEMRKQNRIAVYEKFYSMDDNFRIVTFYYVHYNVLK